MEYIGIILLIILVIAVVIAIACYNVLVSSRNNVKNMWSQIDVQLQRRFDLIPNLIEAVKGYMKHEEKVLTDITELRTSWADTKSVKEKSNLNDKLSTSLKTVMLAVENYPDLKSSKNFIDLQTELSNTETKISSARNAYNDAVTVYNTKIDVIPTNIIASLFHFEKSELFEIESEEIKKNVKVSF